ncbi:hypothetical protein OCC_00302 [Thermococcus litoralis DSM 5473]|uniref:Uncharacterized protein n=1 Tax=Thermococcus litoralis (strain ATCC 51850 / DSM 5473 / JCM 8560 / NS-C) TaxID=523849 RepID=H3ZMG1_THELN|nr:hypothetical protein [Thermococcus litoralis]EHR78842.1 hypothetical protein OCC_00302 [Thermococcus litoralis DSM 5473]
MKQIVLKRSVRSILFLMVFGLVIGAPMLVIVLAHDIPLKIKAGVTAFIGLWFGLTLFAFYRTKRSLKKVEELERLISVSGYELRFSTPVQAEVGYFHASGYWSSSGKSRSYHVFRNFLKESETTLSSLKFENKPFLLAIAQDGEGEVRLPGIRILNETLQGALILYAKPSYKFSFPVESFSVSYEGDFAEARIEETENGFRVSVSANLSKAKRAKVELISRGERAVKELIGDTKNIGVFEKEFLNEPLVIVGHYDQISPLEILKAGKFGRIISGHGKFILRLALDIPFRPDIKEEIEFEVIPKEETTSWGL